jgi:hypothetical protein
MRGHVFALVTVLALAVGGCGVADGSAMPHGRAGPHTLVLRVSDDGKTIHMRVGQLVIVDLSSKGLMWDRPTASGQALRRISASGGYPTTRPARAEFRAVRPGKAGVSSVTDAKCLHAKPRCEIAQRLWHVAIIVSKR